MPRNFSARNLEGLSNPNITVCYLVELNLPNKRYHVSSRGNRVFNDNTYRETSMKLNYNDISADISIVDNENFFTPLIFDDSIIDAKLSIYIITGDTDFRDEDVNLLFEYYIATITKSSNILHINCAPRSASFIPRFKVNSETGFHHAPAHNTRLVMSGGVVLAGES